MFKPSDFQPGDTVHVVGKVLRARGKDDDDPSYQGVDVQLPDGQLVQTNLMNLAGPPADKAVKPAADKAVKKAENK